MPLREHTGILVLCNVDVLGCERLVLGVVVRLFPVVCTDGE